jgi:hypothetical protein
MTFLCKLELPWKEIRHRSSLDCAELTPLQYLQITWNSLSKKIPLQVHSRKDIRSIKTVVIWFLYLNRPICKWTVRPSCSPHLQAQNYFHSGLKLLSLHKVYFPLLYSLTFPFDCRFRKFTQINHAFNILKEPSEWPSMHIPSLYLKIQHYKECNMLICFH